MKTAADYMTPNPKMIASGDTLNDVVKLFLELGITSSPVINPVGEILGSLTELSLVKAFMLHKARFHKNDRVGHHVDLLEPIHYINAEAPLVEVLKEMVSSPTHRLIVRDAKEKIVGIITPKDLMRAMLGNINPQKDLKDKLKQTEDDLKQSLTRVASLEKKLEVFMQAFNETPYMMHAVDKNGKILMANKREHEILGYENNELLGKTIYDLYSKNMHREAEQGLKKVMETGSHHITYTTIMTKSGINLRCDIASSCLHDDNGNFLSTISVLRPIDSSELLRILNGIVDDKKGPLAKYITQTENIAKAIEKSQSGEEETTNVMDKIVKSILPTKK